MTNDNQNTTLSKEDKKMLRKVFWRSFAIFGSWNQMRASAIAFVYALLPVINRYYKTKEERIEAMKRHAVYFNITSAIFTFPLGIAASMEKQHAKSKDFDVYSINAIKASLMGPLSGIGDSFFWGTFRVIAAGIGISFAKEGSILGPILFLVLYNIPAIAARYYGTFLGYSLGVKYIKQAYENGIIQIITKAAGILGLMMVGAMIFQVVGISTPLHFTLGGMEYKLQTILDDIFKGLLPLAATFGCFALLRKKVNMNYIMLGIVVLSFALSLIGIL
ncbi:PTS system mannose/fructose/sorbose family transporter subunit IID [Cytobacillus sp. Hz8]|uniref:PTS system mannose/fructose/sorbose family transporter subunit IID n=1 Tax=Cytobacillus sp. Hz8 TaxID=3347168 RepID=UPI0035E137A3